MFKNLKYLSLILLFGCVTTNKDEKVYTDLIPTIKEEDEDRVAWIENENLFVCDAHEIANDYYTYNFYCDKDGKLFNGKIDDIEDDGYKATYIFKNGKPIKLKTFSNGKLESTAILRQNFTVNAQPTSYIRTIYYENGKIHSKYKFDNDAQSVLEVFCPDGSKEKTISIDQDVDNSQIHVFRNTEFHKVKGLPEFTTIYKTEDTDKLVKGVISYEAWGFTGNAEILDCNGNTVETLIFENGNGQKVN